MDSYHPYQPPLTPGQIPESEYVIPSHPLRLGETLHIAVRLFTALFLPIVAIMVVIYLSLELFLLLNDMTVDFTAPNFSRDAFRLYQAFEITFGVLGTVAVLYLARQKKKGTIDWKEIIRHSFSKWAQTALTMILARIIAVVLLVLGIIPGIIWAINFVFIANAVVLRGYSGKQALNYSKSLVKGRWWRTAGFFLTFFLIAILPPILLSIFNGLLVEFIALNASVIQAMDLFFSLFSYVCMSFPAIAGLVLFLNTEACVKREREQSKVASSSSEQDPAPEAAEGL